jgi:thymidine kinase
LTLEWEIHFNNRVIGTPCHICKIPLKLGDRVTIIHVVCSECGKKGGRTIHADCAKEAV